MGNLVAYSESYAVITEGAVQGFISILSGYDIDNLFLPNPPIQIRQQFEQTFPRIVEVEKYYGNAKPMYYKGYTHQI